MSRYLILVILNTPVILISILNLLVSFKLNHINRRHFISRTAVWLGIFAGLVFAKPIYVFILKKTYYH